MSSSALTGALNKGVV